jgi:TonB family protein
LQYNITFQGCKMKISLLTLSFFSMVLMAGPVTSSNVELVESIIPAESIERVSPRFPIKAARNGNEGWVKLSFVVDKNGTVVDPVIEDSSGIRGFEKASLRAIKQWQYSPAIRNGEKIEQCRNSVQMDFILDRGPKGGRKRFVREYKNADEALRADNIVLAEQLITQMGEGKIWNRYEDAWFWMLKSEIAKAQGQESSQLGSLRRVVSSNKSTQYVGDQYYIYLLHQKFILEIKASLFSDALQTFAQIRQRPDSEKTVRVLEKYATQAQEVLENQDFIIVQGEVDSDGDWWHSLSRNRFMFSDIAGTLDTVEVRCDNKREKYTIAEFTEWKIPKSWGRCKIMVVGDTQANFNLVEIRQDA